MLNTVDIQLLLLMAREDDPWLELLWHGINSDAGGPLYLRLPVPSSACRPLSPFLAEPKPAEMVLFYSGANKWPTCFAFLKPAAHQPPHWAVFSSKLGRPKWLYTR